MAYHQVVDLRTHDPAMYGDKESESAAVERREAARAAQTVPYAVAPGCTVRLPDGRALKEGEEITAADLRDDDEPLGRARERLEKLVFTCQVLEKY